MRDGILTHTGDQEPATLEGKVVRIVDRVAYINHDIDDAIRFGILEEGDLPARGDRAARPDRRAADRHTRPRSRRESARAGDIVQSEEIGGALASLRAFMFERVYLGPATRSGQRQAQETIEAIFDALASAGTSSQAIIDFISGMTDRFALDYARTLP